MSILNFNNDTKKYKYDLSVMEKDEWLEFADQVVFETIGWVNEFELLTYKVSIVDNIAKVKLAYNELPFEGKPIYHECKFKLNEFGKEETNYSDPTSKALQLYMFKHYGNEYYYDALAKQMEAEEEFSK